MAVVTLGGAAHRLVAVLAEFLVSGVLVDSDLGRSSFVALGAIAELLAMSLVVEGDGALGVFVGHDVGSDCCGCGGDECQGHQGYDETFHDTSSSFVVVYRFSVLDLG